MRYNPQKHDAMTYQGERLVVLRVDGGMVDYKGPRTTGRVNLSTWMGMWKDAEVRCPKTP